MRRAAAAAVLVAACSGPTHHAPPPTDAPPLARAADAGPPPPPPAPTGPYVVDETGPTGTALGTITLVTVPPRTATAPRPGPAACGATGAPALEVAPNGGVIGAIVWLDAGRGKAAPAAATAPPAELVFDGCIPRPRAVVVAAPGARLAITSDATVRHEARLTFLGQPWSAAAAPAPLARVPLPLEGSRVELPLPEPGLVEIDGAAAPGQKAWALVPPHPYYTVTDQDGRYRLDGVPSGRYGVHAWIPDVAGLGAMSAVGTAEVVAGAAVEVNLQLAPARP
jgi:hypothetical protein